MLIVGIVTTIRRSYGNNTNLLIVWVAGAGGVLGRKLIIKQRLMSSSKV